MDRFKRYGLYVLPDGDFFDAASAWLGWDSDAGIEIPHPELGNLPEPVEVLTATPRKYGFHGTIKPPFYLAVGHTPQALHRAVAQFCTTQARVVIPKLAVRRIGGFVAIVPSEPSAELATFAATTVESLDPFRAPPTEAELARRRKAGLSERQERLLQRWGYPYVMEEFRFHLTLTGRSTHAEQVENALAAHFAHVLPAPYTINDLALMGEDDAGMFHLIHRYTLSG